MPDRVSLTPSPLRPLTSSRLRRFRAAGATALCSLLLMGTASLASAGTLLVWSSEATPEQAKAWAERAGGDERWTVRESGPDDPKLKGTLTENRPLRLLLHPRDTVDLALLGKTMRADWVLQPGKTTTLLSVRTLQAAALTLTGDAEEDRKAVQEAASAMNRQSPRAGQLEHLALRWLKRGQADPALEILFEAQALEPDRVPTHALLVDAYRIKGDYKEAGRFLRMALKSHKNEPRLLQAAGELELAQDHPREALEFFVKAAGNGNATPALHRLVGETLAALGRYRLAEEEFRLAEGEPGASAQLARMLVKREAWREAAAAASRALEENAGDWEMRFLFARGLSADGQYAQAARDRAQALAVAAEADPSGNPVSFLLLQNAIRDQVADTINAVRQFQMKGENSPLLYTAAQESVIAADRLRSALKGRPDWHSERTDGKQRVLALTLWSQGAYELIKAMESKERIDLSEPGEILHDALRQLDEAQRSGSRLSANR